MSNLTAEKDDQRQNGDIVSVLVAAATKIFKGSNVSFNTSGFAKKGADTASEKFAGVAVETVDNSAGSNGDKEVRLHMEGVVSMGCASATQAWVGQDVFLVDDNLVALAATTTNDVRAGKVVGFVSATEVRVKL